MSSLSAKICVLFVYCAFLESAHGFVPRTFVIKDMAGLASYLLYAPGNRESSVYRAIKKRFENNYERIGSEEIGKLKNGENASLNAGLNHIGMVYNSGFADFSIYLKRELAPDLFDDERYIVIDNLEIYIDAQKLLKNLKDANLIDMTKEQYKAYASVSFKRAYRYIYFADSFEQALNFNLNKLFFTFEVLEDRNYLKMKPYEIISREDSLTIGVGGGVSNSLGSPVNVEFQGFVEFERLSKLEIQAVGPEDKAFEDERIRISFEKKKGKTSMGYSALGVDFLNILKLALFQYEFAYNYSDSYRINLSFKEEDIYRLNDEDSPLGNAVGNVVLAGGGHFEVLKPYIVSQEHRKQERYTSRYSALLRGKSKECQVSEVKIVKDNQIKHFFRHTFERVKYRTDIISKLFTSLVNTFLRLDRFALETKDDFHSRSVCVEYESEKNLMKNEKNLTFDDNEKKMSLKFEETYYVHNPKGKVRDRCVNVLKSCPGVTPDIINAVEKGKIKADMKININYIVNKDAINYFNSRSIAQIYDAIHVLCTAVKSRDEAGAIMKYGKNSKKCERELQERYDRYYKELIAHKYSWDDYVMCAKYAKKYAKNDLTWAVLMEVCIHRSSLKELNPLQCSLPLWHFRNFVDRISEYLNKKEDMYAFFGIENVFFHGVLQGRTLKGHYKTCFKDGNFSGTGLIDNYMREEKMRPESLLFLE